MIERIIFYLLVLITAALLVLSAMHREQVVMRISYCWDEMGEHYVAPDDRCVK